MTIWNLHGTGIQLRIIRSRAHILICNLSFICSDIRYFSFSFFSFYLFPLGIQLQNNFTLVLTRTRTSILSLAHDLTRLLVSPLDVRISCQIIYLVFCVFLYSVCLYSYNNHFPNDYTLNSSNFLHFFTNNNWIVAPNFLSAHFFVIEFAIVLVTVSMHGAE